VSFDTCKVTIRIRLSRLLGLPQPVNTNFAGTTAPGERRDQERGGPPTVIGARFPVVTLRNDSRCACWPYWRILVDSVIVGETASTTEARASAEELAVKPATATYLRDTCAAEDTHET
jgi:hypothetical protein